ncbi:Mnn10p [Sugiyamaella lignohabitans]|uniref:Mnn10p n=1 Tax=Sugiyamaella lignohabitans TaxID=796027 RepID=A0A161HKR8_9ASCO|nr:Mnn10p [Sugiyamaella lignohabitans]ANB13697.1 Mnn10p [Sugiyamaella lignohabitans]
MFKSEKGWKSRRPSSTSFWNFSGSSPMSPASSHNRVAAPAYRPLLNFLLRRKILIVIFIFILLLSLFTAVPFLPHFSFGSANYVIILAANEGGGVMQWKGAREWSVERSSIANKKQYAERHGYNLAIKDVSAKKRYAHEWRESWEKVDIIKETMRQFPNAEWFWWLDLHTYIMEPQISLDSHIFRNLYNETYRDASYFNPLSIPIEIPYVDYNQPIDLVISQDCGGFNLGSFFIRRSEWTEKLLDIWWDPVFYEQKHMDWEHKEQDALETLYRNQAWIRGRVGFIPLRKMNSFPPGACSDMADDSRLFYNEKERDFVVNMAGCEWGRDCWGEMEHYKALSKKLHQKKFWFF